MNETSENILRQIGITDESLKTWESLKEYDKIKNIKVIEKGEPIFMRLNAEEEIESFYKEVENKKIYDIYGDYGNYLIDKYNKSNPEIIKILTSSAEYGDLFSSFRAYQSLIDYYEFDEVMNDYNKACTILDLILDEVVFEKLLLGQFVLFIGYLIKYCKFPEKIIEKYSIYVKEIYNYITNSLKQKQVEQNKFSDEEDFEDRTFTAFQTYDASQLLTAVQDTLGLYLNLYIH